MGFRKAKRSKEKIRIQKMCVVRVGRAAMSIEELLSSTRWHLPSPFTPIHTISVSLPPSAPTPSHSQLSFSNLLHLHRRKGDQPDPPRYCFRLARDDLLHPLANGNKARKLDALLPLLRSSSATHVVSCGGSQSAHAAALAVYCAEMNIATHLLLRGEQPRVPTGYNLVSLMFAHVTYASRSLTPHRAQMLHDYATALAGPDGVVLSADDVTNLDHLQPCFAAADRRVVVVNEGAASAVALLGAIRLIKFLSESSPFRNSDRVHVIVDAGTGATAIGMALGVHLLGLPWQVTGVMLADTLEAYKERERSLISMFKRVYEVDFPELDFSDATHGILNWVKRFQPRKFGKVLNGEIETCRRIAQQTAVPLDPIYTLAAWDLAASLSLDKPPDTEVLMVHTGGTLGMFGLAQRYPSSFCSQVM